MDTKFVEPYGAVLQNVALLVPTLSRLPVWVLIVEDEVLLRAFGVELLVEAGFQVMEAVDGEEAIEYLVGHPEVKLLFTDVRLPGAIDGLQLAWEVHDRWPHMGIIIASGRAAPQPNELPAGTRFHRKPYESSAVVRHAHELTGA
jgi:CheY-like chemotaxis protein